MRTMMRSFRVGIAAAVSLIACVACSESSNRTVGPSDLPGFTLTVDHSQISVEQGKSIGIPVNIIRKGGFTGTVGLTLANVPKELVLASSPAVLKGTQTSSILTINVDEFAPSKTFKLTLRATGPDGERQTKDVDVLVTLGTPGIGLVWDSTDVPFQRGKTRSTQLVIGRRGAYAGQVSLSAESVPAGTSVSVLRIGSMGDTATLDIVPSGDTPPGESTVVLRATAEGLSPTTYRFTFTVQGVTASLLTSDTTVTRGSWVSFEVAVTKYGNLAGFGLGMQPSLVNGQRGGVTSVSTSASSVTRAVSFQVPETLTPGTYTGNIRINAAGQTELLLPFTVRVVDP